MSEAERETVTDPLESGGITLDYLHDVTMGIGVEFGRAEMTVRRLLGLKVGSVIEVDKLAREPLDLRINGRLVARGEVVVVNDKYGVRVTEVVSPDYLSELTPE